MTNNSINQTSATRFIEAPNLSVNVGGTDFVYRDLGPRGGVPLVMLNHWGAVLDNFDPRMSMVLPPSIASLRQVIVAWVLRVARLP